MYTPIPHRPPIDPVLLGGYLAHIRRSRDSYFAQWHHLCVVVAQAQAAGLPRTTWSRTQALMDQVEAAYQEAERLWQGVLPAALHLRDAFRAERRN